MSGDPGAVASVLRERGVRLGIENHPERVPDELRARIDAGEGAFGATVDTGWWATQGYDPARAIEELGERVLHVHLKDVLAVGEPHETCRWGEGIVDIAACVRALQRIGYAGTYTIEHEPEDHDPSEKCRDDARRAAEPARVNVALVGCGNIAPHYAQSIADEPRLTLVGVTDVVPERAADVARRFGVTHHASLEDLLADDRVDTVVNLTAPQAHATVTAAASRRRQARPHREAGRARATTRRRRSPSLPSDEACG